MFRTQLSSEPACALPPANSSGMPRLLPACMTLMFVAALTTPVFAAANVVNLPANPSQQQINDAKTALASGSVIQMTNVSPVTFSGNLNIALPKPKSGVNTQLCVIAAHRGRRGTVHTYSGPEIVSGQATPAACTTGVQTWATKDSLVAYDDGPTAEAWTELTVQTFSTTGKGGTLQETVGVYRVNSSNTQTDYYMITKQADVTPDLETCKEGLTCGYFSSGRYLSIATDIPISTPGYAIFDHGPLQTNSSVTNSYSVGAQISGTGPQVSATFGRSWSQQDVTTKDTTVLSTGVASWTDSFISSFSYSSPPAAVVKLWESDQAVIYTVPVGTLSFTVQINDSASFAYDDGFETKIYPIYLGASVQVSPPSLTLSPPVLRVFPGQTVTFDVNALIPDGTGETLGWTISNIPTGISLNTTTGSGPATIQFNVPASATRGLLGTLNINTSAVFASPEVRSGPLQYPITVINSTDIPPGVLMTGGIDWSPAQVAIFSAEVWNPATQTSTAVGQMNFARAYHTATPIVNDRVFVSGGLNDSLSLIGSTEIYSQATESFSNGPAMQTPRYNHTATLLNDATVLLTGGGDTNNNAIATAEIYDPVSNTTTQTAGNMTIGRVLHTATLLQNGTVLIVGGASAVFGGTIYSSAEIYNPNTKTFTSTGSMSVGLQNHAATLLSNGQVLIAGGDSSNGGFYNGAFVYTPSSGAFTGIPEGASLSHNLALVALPQSSALLINGGGTSLQGTSLWNPTANNFDSNSALLEQRDRPKATLLRNTATSLDGSVVIAGGVVLNTGSTGGESVEVFNPSTNQSSRAGTMTTPRSGNTITLFGGAPASTSVTLTSSQNPSITGNPVTFTAAVGGTAGVPTGTVSFNDGGNALGSPVSLSNGSAQYTANSLSIGQHAIAATYSGDNYNGPSTSSILSHTVNPVAVTSSFTILKASQTTIPPLTPSISVSGVISGPGPIYPATSETVAIVIGSIAMTAQIGGNGVFSITNFPTSTLNAGSYGISFGYAGDTKLTSASDSTSLTLTVVASSTTALTSSLNPSTVGQQVTLTATVASSAGTPTGTVTFLDGSTALGSPVMLSSGTAQSNVTSLSVGPHSITAVYSGMADIAGSISSVLSQTVNAAAVAASFTGLTSAPSINVGASTVTLGGTISGSGPTYPATSEVVTVTINNTSVKANFVNNVGGFTTNFPTSALTAGSYQIVYSYAGDPKLMSKNDNTTSLTVNNPTPSSVGVTSTSASGIYATSLSGQSVTFTASVGTKNGIIATGSVTFFDSATKLQTVALSTASTPYASAQYSTSSLTVGVHNITASYSGDSNYSTGTSGVWPQTVNIPSMFSNLKSILVPVGTQSVVVSGVISGAGPTYPDGSAAVIVQIGGAEGYKIPDSSGNFSITVNISSLTASSYPIQIVFAGDSKLFNTRDSSTTLTRQTITTTKVASSANTSIYGQPVTFTATVGSQNGTPTGSVFFFDGTTSLGPGVVLSGGKASLPISSLAAGTHSITAAYDGGNTNYTKSTSTALTQTVNLAKPSFTVTTPASITQGTASINLSGTIAAGASYPTGTVTVSINGQTGQGNIGASGAFTASVNTGALTVSGSPYPIAYSYPGSANFNSATNSSTGLTVTPVGPAATATAMTASVQQCIPGVPFTLFISVKSAAGTPSGQVVLSRKNPDGTSAAPLPQFLDPAGQWNPALNGSSDALQVGVTTYTATYQGVSNFQASSTQLQITCSAQ